MAKDNEKFKDLIGGVKPLKPSGKITFRKKPPKAKVRTKNIEDDSATFEFSDHITQTISGDDQLFYALPDLPAKTIADLKKGKFTYTDQLDLHTNIVDEARENLSRFLQFAIDNNHRCVLVIHGRGKHDIVPPILKNHVNHWLRQFPHVLAFCSALPKDGGVGAVYVLLRNKDKIKA